MIWRRRCRTMIADMPSLISISSRLISAGKARSSSLHGLQRLQESEQKCSTQHPKMG
uniref:Putative actin-depolymerizing factor family protein n=1 Tax=Rhizophora mucronata TaxID=61149 RepID=A0A2P2JB46_RHIMU